MITARAGDIFVPVLQGAPTGLAGTIGVRVVDELGATAVVRSTVGVVEVVPGSGIYTTSVVAPTPFDLPDEGVPYVVVWDTGGAEPDFASEELLVLPESPVLPPPPGAPVWAPSVREVADVTPAYTRGGFDDDRPSAGAEQGTFTELTSPTYEHVEGLIRAACDEVAGRVATTIDVAQYGLARAAAKWHVAAMIAAGKTPAGTDDASGEYRSHIANFRATLDELVKVSRMGATRLA